MTGADAPVGASLPRLLYIDDDAGLCRLVERGLGRRGWSVVSAQDGAIGERIAGESRFDVVAVDHFMPGQDGLTTLEGLCRLPTPPPVVYVTGADETRIAVAALKAGAADYVVKSASDDFLDLLVSALDQAMATVRLQAERDAATTALLEANTHLEAVVARQATLLREVNHRVANSLQLVSALVHMQAGTLTDPAARAALNDTQARLSAVMQVHKRLYTSDDVQSVDMGEYLKGLVAELELSFSAEGAQRPIRVDAPAFELDTDRAVSLGVMVAELITNAHKYAYGPEEDGEIRVSLHAQGGDALLVVEDDGGGFDLAAKPKGSGLGHKVIDAMARSLHAKLEYDPSHKGARALLRFDA